MTKQLISVAMATYNGEKYIEKQLKSILSQSYSNIEVIISDDNSTDNTLSIIKKIKDERIKLIENKVNKGFVKNFEVALSNVHGEFIALADQDDIWECNKIEELYNNISDFDLIHSDASLIDKNDNIISSSYTKTSNKAIQCSSVEDFILNNPVTGCTTLISRRLLDVALPIPEGVPVHDKWLACIATLGNGITYFPSSLIRYRQHSNNQIGAAQNRLTINKLANLKSVNKKNEKGQLFLINSIKERLGYDSYLLEELRLYYQYVNSGCNRWKAFYIRVKNINIFNLNSSFLKKIVLTLQAFK